MPDLFSELVRLGCREAQTSPYDQRDRKWWYSARDEVGVRWVMEVRFWRFSKYSKPDSPVEDGWDVEVHFKLDEDNCFRMTRSIRHMDSLDPVVEFCESMWRQMGCDYSKRYEAD